MSNILQTAILFTLTTFFTVVLFYRILLRSTDARVLKRAPVLLLMMIVWLGVQAIIMIKGIYFATIKTELPPKLILLGIAPMLLLIAVLFATKWGRQCIDSLPLQQLTCLHVVRIPVEIVLYLLFVEKAVPQLMTFEGRNFDILAGITAPIAGYYCFAEGHNRKNILLLWNFVALALLLNIVVNALLSAPTPLQRFGFDQPNIAIVQFPYSWLPTFIVPAVLFCHLAAIRRLTKTGDGQRVEPRSSSHTSEEK